MIQNWTFQPSVVLFIFLGDTQNLDLILLGALLKQAIHSLYGGREKALQQNWLQLHRDLES